MQGSPYLTCIQMQDFQTTPKFASRAFRMPWTLSLGSLPLTGLATRGIFHQPDHKMLTLCKTWKENTNIPVTPIHQFAQQNSDSHRYGNLKHGTISSSFVSWLPSSSLCLMYITTCWISLSKKQWSTDQCTVARVAGTQMASEPSTPAVFCSGPCPYQPTHGWYAHLQSSIH